MATIIGTTGSDVLVATGVNDVLYGGDGDDTLRSRFNLTSLRGDGGNDVLQTNVTVDAPKAVARATLVGGLGDDTLNATVLATSAGSAEARTLLSGEAGADTLNVTTTAQARGFGTSLASATLWGGEGDDIITAVTTATAERGSASAHSDVRGHDGGDRVSTTVQAHIDAIIGADPAKQVATAWNEVHGKPGNDVLTLVTESSGGVASATNLFRGDDGDDHLTGKVTAQAFFGLAKAVNNVMDKTGSDVFDLDAKAVGTGDADAHAETFLTAAAGVDSIDAVGTAIANTGDASIKTEIWGGAGNDVIVAHGTASSTGGRAAADVFLSGATEADQLTAVTSVTGSATSSVYQLLDGGADDDVLRAVIADHRLPGTATGIARSDLRGGTGNDRLTVEGGSGNLLNGGAGNDTLVFGSGADTGLFALAGGHDTIERFDTALDVIRLTGFGLSGFGQLSPHLVASGSNTVIRFATGEQLTLIDLAPDALDTTDFLFA